MDSRLVCGWGENPDMNSNHILSIIPDPEVESQLMGSLITITRFFKKQNEMHLLLQNMKT